MLTWSKECCRQKQIAFSVGLMKISFCLSSAMKRSRKPYSLSCLTFLEKGALRDAQLGQNVDHVTGVVGMLHKACCDLPRKPGDAVADLNAEFLVELADHVDVPDKGGYQLAVSTHPLITHASYHHENGQSVHGFYAAIIMGLWRRTGCPCKRKPVAGTCF